MLSALSHRVIKASFLTMRYQRPYGRQKEPQQMRCSLANPDEICDIQLSEFTSNTFISHAEFRASPDGESIDSSQLHYFSSEQHWAPLA